jgi:peptide/nickel transport system permease protein
MGPRVPTTLLLVGSAFIMIMVFGLSLGIVAALRGGVIDTATMATATLLSAIPAFVSSFVLINVFALQLGWFPAIGIGDGTPIDTARHLVLPSVALALGAGAFVARPGMILDPLVPVPDVVGSDMAEVAERILGAEGVYPKA